MLKTDRGSPGHATERVGALTAIVHGARGSLPAGGPGMARYGGETSCVEVRSGARSVVLDAGSGIAAASAAMLDDGIRTLDVFLSHLHFDHVCGLPFIAQLGDPGGRVRIWLSERFGAEPAMVVAAPFGPPNFPVALDRMPGRIEWRTIREGSATMLGPIAITARPLDHPGGATGFRVEAEASALAYVMDHEPGGSGDREALALMDGADLALMDATYTPEEIEGARGWGHGDWRACGTLAREAGARRWAMFHHHYLRTDEALDREAKRAHDEFGAAAAASGSRYEFP